MTILAQLIDGVVASRHEITGTTSLGRKPANDIQIDDIAVSSEHALIHAEPSEFFEGVTDIYVEDLSSTNGTFVNGQQIQGRHKLNNNDIVRIAWNEFKIMIEAENTLEQTAHILQ